MCVNDQELLTELQATSKALEERHGYTPTEVLDLIAEDKSIPATAFSTELSPLQAAVTYLHDHDHQGFPAIAEHLKRSYRAVWGAYHAGGIAITATTYTIPLAAIDDHHSVLECVVTHLKEHHHLRLAEIAKLLNKDPRTIWTTWDRAKKKNAQDR